MMMMLEVSPLRGFPTPHGALGGVVADGIEGSAVVYKRDHSLLPGPKHAIHQQSQQLNTSPPGLPV